MQPVDGAAWRRAAAVATLFSDAPRTGRATMIVASLAGSMLAATLARGLDEPERRRS